MKQVIIFTGNVGRYDSFLSPGVGHRCHCVIIANGTIITDGFLIQALSSTPAQFQRFRLKTVFVLFFTLAR